MSKSILITGSTDGIGLEAAKKLAAMGHRVLLHGRSETKLAAAKEAVAAGSPDAEIAGYLADLSKFDAVEALAQSIRDEHESLDVLINNAGIFRTGHPITADGLDVRFVVNTFAPYLLMQRLMPVLGSHSRVVNLSSAAQSTVSLSALKGENHLSEEFDAYAQSKLAITMWTRHIADALRGKAPMVVAINPGSLLGTKMVQEGFGMAGKDVGIGVDIIVRAALADEFADAGGKYFDNDSGQFAPPHADALDSNKVSVVVQAVEEVLAQYA
ncbi:MAG: SDR family NAD(P)-dependent oxidoreductase [Pseudomonadota bacterium]